METYNKEERYLNAKKKLDKIRGFYRHLLWYVVINLFLVIWIGVEAKWDGDQFWNFGTFSTAVFWGIGLLVHGVTVFVPGFFFGREWEERQIRKFMEKENRRRWK